MSARRGVADGPSWLKSAALEGGARLGPKLPGLAVFHVPDGGVTQSPECALDVALVNFFERGAVLLLHLQVHQEALDHNFDLACDGASAYLRATGDARLRRAADVDADTGAPSLARFFDRPPDPLCNLRL